MKGKIKFGENGQPDRFFVDNKEVTKEAFDLLFPPKEIGDGSGLCAWKRPMLSDALAVHPAQVAEANARNKRHGVNVEYLPGDGRAIIPDREARRKLMAIEGCHDKNGGYGDDHATTGGFLDVRRDGGGGIA